MTQEIIVALITGICAVIGTLIGQWALLKRSHATEAAERARLDERTDQRLQAIEHEITNLEAQVREHNGLKQDIAEIKTEIRNLKERV